MTTEISRYDRRQQSDRQRYGDKGRSSGVVARRRRRSGQTVQQLTVGMRSGQTAHQLREPRFHVSPPVAGEVVVPAAAAAGAAGAVLVLDQRQPVIPPAPLPRQRQHQRQHHRAAQHHEHHPEQTAGAVPAVVYVTRPRRRWSVGG